MTDLIGAHLAHLRAAGKSRHTIEDRGKLLRRLDREWPYGIDEAAVEEWESFLGRPDFAAQTRATYWLHGNGFYRWAVARGFISWNPLAHIDRPRVPAGVPHPVTEEQLALALDRAVRPYRTGIILAAYAGFRASEVADATKQQISAAPIRIHGKGDKTRIVPAHEIIRAELPHLPDGPIIARPGGGPYNGDVVSRTMSAYLTSIGLPEVTLHWFRHWYATTMLANGANLRTVQELMGHSSPAVTAVYTQISDEQRRLAICTLPVLTTPHQEAA